MSAIDDIKARLDIVDVVSGYVSDLRKSGRTWKARCPFHQERTPSFVVDPDRGTWHCFGACSTGGDVIEFVRRAEHLEFPEALERLAQRAGIELRPVTAQDRQQREVHERLLAANEAATLFFQAQLDGAPGTDALAYAERRGLDRPTRQTWQLGYAPDGWADLCDHLRARGFTDRDLLDAGLAIEGDRGVHDRFRDRLIFPIRDRQGRAIGFGARALHAGQEPKYLNTAQTPLFDKSATLYGLDRAGEEARRADRLIVVEGYMDVIGCQQAGIPNVVASMGTAITDRQMALVQRYTHNLVLALDADAAGSEATLRGVQVAAGAAEHDARPSHDWRGLVSFQDVLKADIRVAVLPAGEDPDSLARTDAARLRQVLDEAQPVLDYVFAAIAERADLDQPRERSRVLETLAGTVAAIADPVVRAHYVQRLARLARVDEVVVAASVERARRTGGPAASRNGRVTPAPVPSPAEVRRAATRSAAAPDGEEQLLQLLLLRPEARTAGLSLDADTFEDTLHRRLFEAWRLYEDIESPESAAGIDEDLRACIAALRERMPESFGAALLDARQAEAAITSIAGQLRLRRQQSRLRPAAVAHATELAEARRRGDAETDALDAELMELAERQRDLSRQYRAQRT